MFFKCPPIIPQVANYTYECFFPGQELNIRIMAGGWLHRGTIICPPCKEICGEQFERAGLECRIREEAPPSNKYPRDELQCGGATGRRPAASALWLATASAAIVLATRSIAGMSSLDVR